MKRHPQAPLCPDLRRGCGLSRRTVPLAVMAFVLLPAIAGAAGAREFRAGADRADITPELGTLIVGSFNPQPATHVHDPLYARTLVLDDGTTRLAFVVCDNLGLPQVVCDAAKRLITQHTGIPASHVLIAATHTHSAGSARERTDASTETRDGFSETVPRLGSYQQFIARRIADSVRNAVRRLEPAKIGWGAGTEPSQVFNRRWHVKSEDNRRNPFGGVDTVRMNPPSANQDDLIKPAGPTDPEIAFVSVQSESGRPIALLANYSLHYVGGVLAGAISADYFGVFAERLAEMLGAEKQDPPFVAMMSNGTSGDINNINFRNRGPSLPPYEKMRRVGNMVAAEVFRAYQTVPHHDWVQLDARYEELSLRPRRPTPEMVTYARERLAQPEGTRPWHTNERSYARSVVNALESPDELRVPIQVFRLGDLGIAATPVETLVEIGLEIKARTPFAKSFTLSIANGSFGYMPTVEQHRLGGYETWLGTNRLEIEAAPKMVARLLAMFDEMRTGSGPTAGGAVPHAAAQAARP
jgi:neutral ceramidase